MNNLSSANHQLLELPQLVEEFRRNFSEWTERAGEVANGTELRAIVTDVFTNVLNGIEELPSSNDDLVQRIHQYMADNLHRGLTLKDLAEFLGYSEKYCSDFFRIRMGSPFSHYLRHLRVTRATHLLLAPRTTLATVAEALGFCDQFAFSHFFKKAVGCSPDAFRRSHRIRA
jgi:AraC-like DNA-binding protein